MPKPTRPQLGLVLMILATGVFQIVCVTSAAIPTNKFSDRIESTTAYLSPYFTQNWRLFAPNPISEDRSVWFRGEYLDSAGETKTTAWFDWTAVELDLVRKNIIGGRAGYITNKMITPLNKRYYALNGGQREIADKDGGTVPQTFPELRKALIAAGDGRGLVNFYLAYETSTVRLATAVMRELHPGLSFTAIQYRVMSKQVLAFDSRNLPEPERSRVRPIANIRESGWRTPVSGSPTERRVIGAFLERHR